MVYLTEKTSEHPIAVSICEQIAKNIPGKIEIINENYTVADFKNRNGEGVVSTIKVTDGKTIEVLCGNTKLMQHYEVFVKYPELEKNITYLE